jgi:hypothetical protein
LENDVKQDLEVMKIYHWKKKRIWKYERMEVFHWAD